MKKMLQFFVKQETAAEPSVNAVITSTIIE
jgi:hypothetical protein